MSHYQDIRKAAMDLSQYVADDNRSKWSTFTRTMRKRYGFSPKFFLKMISEDYPFLVVEHDELITKGVEQ